MLSCLCKGRIIWINDAKQFKKGDKEGWSRLVMLACPPDPNKKADDAKDQVVKITLWNDKALWPLQKGDTLIAEGRFDWSLYNDKKTGEQKLGIELKPKWVSPTGKTLARFENLTHQQAQTPPPASPPPKSY